MPANESRRSAALVAASLLFAVAALTTARSVVAHATLYLFGEHAQAGQPGTLTLRIPHGCTGGLTTDGITTRFSPRWVAIEPQAVEGWVSEVKRSPRGTWTVTWTATAGGLPDGETGDFPLTVTWPAKAGDYATPTVQSCGVTTMKWTDLRRGAADGENPSPPVYPSPWVRVHPTP